MLRAVDEQQRLDQSPQLLVSLASLHRLLSSAVSQQKERPRGSDVNLPSVLSTLHRLLIRGVPLTLASGHVQTSVAAPSPSASRVPSSAHWHSPFASSASLFALPATSAPCRSTSSSVSFTSSSPLPSPHPLQPSTLRTTPPPARSKAAAQDEQIRLAALVSLTLLAQHRAKAFHLHWVPFIPPDVSSSLSPRPFSGHHLLTVILFDPSPEVRTSAALLLSHLLPHSPLSKPHPPNLGRTPGSLPARNAEIIRGLHVGLLDAIKRETHTEAQVAVVKAVTALAGHIPYEQQPSGLLTPLVTHLVDELLPLTVSPARPTSRSSSRPPSVPPSPSSSSVVSRASTSAELKPTVFAALSAVFSRPLPELDELLTRKPTLLPFLLSLAAARSPTDSPVDAWLPLSKLARYYPSHLLPHWKAGQPSSSSLSSLILSALSSTSDPIARSSALRLMEDWTRLDASELRGGEEGGEEDREDGGVREPVGGRVWENDGVLELYGVHLPLLYRTGGGSTSGTAGVGAKVIALFGFIPYTSWTLLSPPQMQEVLDCVKAAARDEAAAVRTAACHCISLYAVYAARAGGDFVEEGVALLTHLLSSDEAVITVRARAAWAVANFSDPPTPSTAPAWYAHTSPRTFDAILTTILAACQGNEKVVAQAVRAVGNVGRWWRCDSDQLWPRMEGQVVRVLEGGRSAKVRWNAAYAMGNLLRNPVADASILIPPLLNTLHHHLSPLSSPVPSIPPTSSSPPNFKVSINAAMALASPPTRAAYCAQFSSVVRAVLEGVAGCEVLVLKDWREVGYREGLQAHLTVALCHVLAMVELERQEEVEVGRVVREGWEVISRVVLRERVRADGERSRARLSSATKRAAAAVVGASAAAAASSPISFPHPSSALLNAVVKRVAALLHPDIRARFLSAADGDIQ